MKIVEITAVTDEVVAAFARLLPQLASSTPPPGRDVLEQIVRSPGTVLFAARDAERGGEIVGVLTLALYRIPTASRAWIEDVVVDASARGKGVGEALTRAAMDRARAAGATAIDLTSRPSREAANRLYQRLGFQLRETNCYRYTFEPKGPYT
jgi:ribosomal protein S18 acetylase RimI-like enzyme